MFKNLLFLSQKEAESLPPIKNSAIISITSPDQELAKLHFGWNNVLRLQFHDISKEFDGDEIPDFENKNIIKLKAFSEDQARTLIDFLNRMDGEVETIIVHCLMGISRSAAVAEFIRVYYTELDKLNRPIKNRNSHVFWTLEKNYSNYGSTGGNTEYL